MKNLAFILLTFFILISCSKEINNSEDDQSPYPFEVTVQSINFTVVSILWSPSLDPEGKDIFYKIYLDDHLVVDSISNHSHTFFNLAHHTAYTGKVMAFDPQGNNASATFSFTTLEANVLNSGKQLFDQQAVNDFAQNEYNVIKGDLKLGNSVTIYGVPYSNISDLSGLFSLSSIEGTLTIHYNKNLTSLDGLQNIISVGGLTIDVLEKIVNLDDLQSLSNITGSLNIHENNKLINIDALERVTTLNGNLDIISNQYLPNIDGLQNLTTVGGDLKMRRDGIQNVEGLRNLVYVGGNVHIGYNYYLGTVDLENITLIGGNLEISHGVNGINKLTKIGGDLSISGSVDGFQNLRSIGGLYLSGGGHFKGLQNLESIGTISLSETSLEDLDFLQSVDTVKGDLYIRDYGIKDLNGLKNLVKIKDNFSIINNYELLNIDGLSKLTLVGGKIYLAGNSQIQNINGFQNLTSAGDIEFYNNYNLSNLDGFQNLISVNSLSFSNNNYLHDLCGIKLLLENNPNIEYYVHLNYYNPTIEDIISGNCRK